MSNNSFIDSSSHLCQNLWLLQTSLDGHLYWRYGSVSHGVHLEWSCAHPERWSWRAALALTPPSVQALWCGMLVMFCRTLLKTAWALSLLLQTTHSSNIQWNVRERIRLSLKPNSWGLMRHLKSVPNLIWNWRWRIYWIWSFLKQAEFFVKFVTLTLEKSPIWSCT